ncbi:MAG: hypothetical protein ACTHJL_03770 [Amnibacterium sp.]
MTINWLAFLTVFVSSVVVACAVVALFATAIRLLATPPHGAPAAGAARDEEMDDVEGPSRPLGATVGAVVLFVVAALVALYGIYLIVPVLHG